MQLLCCHSLSLEREPGMEDYHSSIYVWGSTAHGALGCLDGKAATSKKVQLVPRRLVPSPPSSNFFGGGSAIQVAAGNGFSTCVTDKWEAYSWGDGNAAASVDGKKNGRGRNHSLSAKNESGTIRKIKAENITSIDHGVVHTCARTLKGEIYGWGVNTHGNLGLDSSIQSNASASNNFGRQRFLANATSRNSDLRRRVIPNPRKIDIGGGDCNDFSIKVACGEKHTCILQRDGTLITLGSNDAGQLGIGLGNSNGTQKVKNQGFQSIESARIGQQLLSSIRFKEISCGCNHSAAISFDGGVYTWGWGMNGRLGHGDEKLRNQPTHVDALSEIVPFAVVACGSAHTLVSTEDGNVFGFGWNAHGQVVGMDASSSSEDCLLPVSCLEKKGVVMLSCSGFHSAAITLSGDLYMWGMNEDGQCGVGTELPITSPSKVAFQDNESEQHVVSVACGHSHTVCILSNYLPLEASDMISRLEKYPLSAQIIVRFARYAIFRLRLRRLIDDVKSPAAHVPPVIQSPEVSASKETPKEDLELDETSSLSSHSSWSDDPHNMNADVPLPKNDELYQRVIEMQKMSDEDHRSSAHRSHLRAIRQRAIEAENLAMEEKRAELERNKMSKEDALSKKLKAHTKSQKDLKRSTKRKNKAVTARDTRANDQIQKAANRLKLAREQREQAKAHRILPKVQRKQANKNREKKKCTALDDIVENKQTMTEVERARLARRQKLVRRRESRLKSKEEAENEMAKMREQSKKEREERDRLERDRMRRIMEEERRKVEREKKAKLLKKTAELRRLENELKLNNRINQLRGSDHNKENNGETKFHDLKHWTSELSGLK